MNLKVEKLTKSFYQGDTQIQALSDVSFELDNKKSLALVGPSGSGKTTLLSLLGGLEEVTSGHIFIDGLDITQLSEKEMTKFRSEKIGIVFQQFHLMPYLTALENVSLPLEISGEDLIEKRAKEVLEQVGLTSRLHHLPSQMSGGECQRVAIARAFVSRPQLLLADEPSGNLDTETGEKVMDLLFSMSEKNKQLLVLVTHDLKLAERCEERVYLKGGKRQ